MKKIMIAAAIVCAAVMGQAAQVNWDVDWVYSTDGDAVNTYDIGSTVNFWVLNLGAETDLSGIAVDTEGNLVNSASYAVLGTGSITESASNTATGTIANGNYLALVIYDADNNLWGVSDVAQVQGIVDQPPTAGSLADRVFMNDAEGYLAANQATVAVPEPTSGLLLLLGMAGLALRRKQA